MPAKRRVWCSCVIIDYLQGAERAKPCIPIISDAERGEIEIVASMLSMAEVVKVRGSSDEEAERRILEFFSRDYVVLVNVDRAVTEIARRIVRTHRGIKPLDAVHIATALHLRVPILESFDQAVLDVNGKEGNPALVIRYPLYEGPGQQASLFDTDS